VRKGRLAGRLLVAAGALTCLWAAADWTRAALARDRARSAWEARDAQAAVLAATSMTVGGPSRALRPPPGAPVARVMIPRLDLDEVVVEGVDDDALSAGPGHMPATPLPGEPGNAVLSAHRDRHFSALADIALGDTIVTETNAGRATWVVTRRRIVHRDARVLKQGPTPELTLTTCWPIRWLGSAPDRLIVTATPVVQLAVAPRGPATP
jgi:LPXTG-site transpeptidase (sortase) family protein